MSEANEMSETDGATAELTFPERAILNYLAESLVDAPITLERMGTSIYASAVIAGDWPECTVLVFCDQDDLDYIRLAILYSDNGKLGDTITEWVGSLEELEEFSEGLYSHVLCCVDEFNRILNSEM